MLAGHFKFKHSVMSSTNKTALELALEYGHTDCALLLLKNSAWDVTETTPLHLAIKHRKIEPLQVLEIGFFPASEIYHSDEKSIENSEEADNDDFYENLTVSSGNFINLSTYINQKDSSGKVPAHIAIELGEKEMLKLLWQRPEIDKAQTNTEEKTVMQAAKAKGWVNWRGNLK